MLLWHWSCALFAKKSSHNQQTGGVPLPFLRLGTIILSFTHKTNGFLMVLGCPKGTPAGKYMGPRWYFDFVAAQPRAFIQQIPRTWDQRIHIPREVLGKRERRKMVDFHLSLRLVDPEGPADKTLQGPSKLS